MLIVAAAGVLCLLWPDGSRTEEPTAYPASAVDLEEIQAQDIARWEDMPLAEHMALYEKQGLNRKEAMRQVAKDRGVPKREIYRQLLETTE